MGNHIVLDLKPQSPLRLVLLGQLSNALVLAVIFSIIYVFAFSDFKSTPAQFYLTAILCFGVLLLNILIFAIRKYIYLFRIEIKENTIVIDFMDKTGVKKIKTDLSNIKLRTGTGSRFQPSLVVAIADSKGRTIEYRQLSVGEWNSEKIHDIIARVNQLKLSARK